jgi:hypothetical protein
LAEALTVSRKRVDARNWWSWVDLSANKSSVPEFPETVGQHAVREAGDGTFEFAEASWPLQQEKQKLECPPLGQHLQLPCEILRQLKRGLVSATFLAGHCTAGHQRSRMAKFSVCTMPLCTLERTSSCDLSVRRAILQESGIARPADEQQNSRGASLL